MYPTILIHTGLAWWRRTPGQASERLFHSIDGLIENVDMSQHFLDSHANYLDNEELINAKMRLFKPLFRKLLKALLTLNISEFISILKKKTNINWALATSIFYKHSIVYRTANPIYPLNTIYDK